MNSNHTMIHIENSRIKKEMPELDSEIDVADGVHQEMMPSVMCAMNENLANHASAEHSESCAIEGSKLRTEDQTHVNYYDELQTVKVEFDENEIKREDQSSLELLSAMSSYSNDDTIVTLEVGPRMKRNAEEDDVPSTKNIRIKTNGEETYRKQQNILVTPSLHPRDKLTKLEQGNENIKQEFKSHTSAQYIIQTGHKLFACTICNYKCGIKNRLKRHISIHTGEKPFACSFCDYKCTWRSNLVSHIRIHTGEKPFTCDICDYKCTQRGQLIVHIRTHTGEKPFSCDVCDYKCNQLSSLRCHIRTHTVEKPFACNECGFKCNRIYNLRCHIRTHAGEKPFACHMCDYKCNQRSNLRRHIRRHSGKKSFACNVCDYKCITKNNLKRHISKHESGERVRLK